MKFDKKTQKELVSKLLKYIKTEFPMNAKSWNQSTDEITTIGYWIAEELEYDRYDKIFTETSNTPALRNRKWYDFISKNVTKLTPHALEQLAMRFGRWFDFGDSKLYENSQFQEQESKFPAKNLKFLTNKTNQFEIESGVIFENLVDPKIADMQISLKYHVNNSSSFETFIASINEFLGKQNLYLTSIDIEKLKIHVEKYV